MRARTTMAVVTTTATLIIGAAVQAQAAAPVRLTPTSTSTQNDIVVPLAGSASTLILLRQPHYSRDVNHSASADPPYSSAPETLYARSSTGRLQTIGTVPRFAETYDMSLVGTTLATGKVVDDDSPATNEAYVWRISTGKRTEIDLPAGDIYLSAAPNGILFDSAEGVLSIRTISGATSSLGSPFGATKYASIISATAGANGVVVTDATGHIGLIPFAAPHTMTALQNPTPSDPIACYQVDASYGACARVAADDDGYGPLVPILVPLDGGMPTVDTTSGCVVPARLAIAGATEVWTCTDLTPVGVDVNDYTLDSLTAGSPTSVTSSTAHYFPLVSAYGNAIGSTPAQDSLYAATSATDVSTLIPVTASPVTVDSFRLIANALLYSDDQRVSSRPGQSESVFERTLSTNGSSLHATTAKLVGASATDISGNLIGVSKSIKVYATVDPATRGTANAVLHVQSSHGATTLSHVISQGVIQVSGNRVLYQRRVTISSSDNVVYDAATDKTTVVDKIGDGIDYTGVALSGGFAAYATTHGAVYRLDLRTGKKTLLRKALPGDVGGVEFSVYANGNWVGWHALAVQHELAKPLNQIRNARTMAPAISLPHTLYSLTSAGAILDSTHASFRLGDSEADEVAKPSRFWLRSDLGQTRSLLPKASYLAGPEIAGGILAWADADGVLRAKLLGG